MKRRHEMPFGAAICDDGAVRFRLWAPAARAVELCVEGASGALPLTERDDGWFDLTTRVARPGARYRYRIDGGISVPDPASRWNPDDVDGPSTVVDPFDVDWNDADWRGRPWREAVVYELHVGTFTPEGTFAAAANRLEHLRRTGITAIELMPVADFAGQRGWGYDGALPFAPDSSYGTPAGLKQLVMAAHGQGLMVLLDVVYNHFGPVGNYLAHYAPQFFSSRHRTPWGPEINFDGDGSRVVRDFFIANALYWLEEFHFDGLRLDAVHAIADQTTPHFLDELAATARSRAGERHIHILLENDDNASALLKRDGDGRPLAFTAQWNDDIHHSLHTILTGERDGYYGDYADAPLEHLGRCLTEGFAYQGERSALRARARGSATTGLPLTAFVSFLQNHDQIGNRAFGERLTVLCDSAALATAVAIVLLSPSPPLLFMGEEFGATTPFLYFCDFDPALASAVREGRRREFERFARFRDPAVAAMIPDPQAWSTFRQSKLDWSSCEQPGHARCLARYRELLDVRRRLVVPLTDALDPRRSSFRRVGGRGLDVRWGSRDGRALRLLANLGAAADWPPIAPGDVIYTTGDTAAEALAAPWSATWLATADGTIPPP
ncbi:MAG TPA: malto-oligosyltrehalose trehalohydrolase [Casimicrobiaceae bacterium]|nr:malto-oligosyltrehalose trehalohydrolase [Casimicrobiaceae bacterium]